MSNNDNRSKTPSEEITPSRPEIRELIARAIFHGGYPSGKAWISWDAITAGHGVRDSYLTQADRILSALTQAGLVIVPVEMTPEMIKAGENAAIEFDRRFDMPEKLPKGIYRAMLAAHKDATCPNE